MDRNINITAHLYLHDVHAESVRCLLEKIMSKISDFADRMAEHNNAVDAAVDGLTQDVKTLNDKITALQASAGSITPEDQALLDAIEARATSISAKLTALDAMTPPPVPPG